MGAALLLGRCRRNVLLFDNGLYRNAKARRMHGFPTRDGIEASELHRLSLLELERYPNVQRHRMMIVHARSRTGGFELRSEDGALIQCRKLLLATGLVDLLPALDGLEDLLGLSVHHCPYCDGWEYGDRPLFAYSKGDDGAQFALELTLWSQDVVLCTHEDQRPSAAYLARLQARGIRVRTERILRLRGDASQVTAFFEDGSEETRAALFYNAGCRQRSALAVELGAEIGERGGVRVHELCTTSVAGLYVAGDMSRDALQVVVAAGEGATAAKAINAAMLAEDLC